MCKIVQTEYTLEIPKLGETFKERLGGFNRFGLRISHGTIIAAAALLLILFIAVTIRLLPLRWENLAGGTSFLNEFDPFYQLSITRHMVDNGLLSPYYPTPWIDTMKWYPVGLDMSTSLPALPATAAVLYGIASIFSPNIDLMTFCAILPAFIAAVSCLILYFVGKDMGGRTVGLFSALFLALAPSFLQRSSLGFFDTEIPGILGLVLFVFFFLRSMDGNRSLRSSLLYSLGAGLALAYFISGWGAAYYVIGLASLFVFVMVLLKRYTTRMLVTYSVTFGLALMLGTLVPYIGLRYLTSGAILPVAAVFVVLLIAELLRNNISVKSKLTLTIASLAAIIGGVSILAITGSLVDLAGKFITVLNPFIRSSSPLVDSVAEQRLSGWGNLYIELGIGIMFFLIGLFLTIRKPTNRNIFMLLFAATSLYFATSMVRLLVIFAPAYAIIAAIGIYGLLKPLCAGLKDTSKSLAKSKRKIMRVSREYGGIAILFVFILLVTNLAISPQSGGMPRPVSQALTPTAISASSLPVGGAGLTEPVTAWIEAVTWLKENAKSTDVVVMWWDYGNWLSDLGNVTSLADNTTVNSTQIANVGFIFMGDEEQAMKMLSSYGQQNTKYIAIFTVLALHVDSSTETYYMAPAGYGDEGKWTWMARISGQDKQRFIDQGFISAADAWVDETTFGESTQYGWEWNDRGLNTTIVKLLTYTEYTYCALMQEFELPVYPSSQQVEPLKYFKPAASDSLDSFAGILTSPFQYGLVPIVAIFEIDWAAYNLEHPIR